MSSIWGDKVKISLFGESHGTAIGITIDGLPAGFEVDFDKITLAMNRRKPGQNNFSTNRNEADIPEIISGLYNGKTTGFPLTAIIKNTSQHSADYSELSLIPRPGHADYTAFIKYGGNADMRGGGHFSGRLTAPLVFAGDICSQILESRGITVGAHALSICGVFDNGYSYTDITKEILDSTKSKDFPVLNDASLSEMKEVIEGAAKIGDSVGGIIECAAVNLPVGVGSPCFSSIESVLSSILFSVPAVKGVEFGAGFKTALMTGMECNDSFFIKDGKVKTKTNNNGGINGGITNGMPLVFKVAIKPTPSIYLEQNSVNLETMQDSKLKIKGRHDPCIVFRAVPVIEAVTAIALINLID